MATNKIALIRYQTIDKCLQNHFRKWTLEDLIEKVSEALYEYEGITSGVSKRTIQGDIQVMRSDKLGYNAPIVVREKKFYEYEDLEEHARLHRDLVERAGTFHQATVTNQLSTGQLIDFIIDDLVKGHMLKKDRKFYHLFRKMLRRDTYFQTEIRA